MLKKIVVIIFLSFISTFASADNVETSSEWGLVYPVNNLIENIYDKNEDGQLVDIEVLYFLRDVMRAATRKGKFQVVSGILNKYDQDSDGWISDDEAKNIEAFLY